MTWHERVVLSWKELNQAIEADLMLPSSPSGLGYLLRGHAKSSWELTPSLPRILLASDINVEKALEIEDTLRGIFTSQAHEHLHPNIGLNIKKSKLLDWWMIMQHYSAPTRLLDWTQSPYVATYFALIEEFEEDGMIWYFHSPTLDSSMRALHDQYGSPLDTKEELERFEAMLQTEEAPEHLWVLKRPIQTDRMAIQQSIYTLCPFILGHHGDIICKTLPHTQGDLINPVLAGRWIIPSGKKMEILAALRVANITANSLFPGLDGLGRAMEELAQLESAHCRESDK